MKKILPGALLGLAVAVVGILINQVAVVVLGLVFGLLAVALLAMRSTQEMSADVTDDLSPESRILIKPLRKLYQEMQDAAAGKSASISPYLATEAMQEAKRLLDKSAGALALRDRLVKQSREAYPAQKNIEDLQASLAAATTDEERTSLQSAITARQQELAHYGEIKDGVAKIESSVRQAEAALAEMRAKMVSSGSAGLADQGSDSLRDAVGRMQALSTSLTEVQQLDQQP